MAAAQTAPGIARPDTAGSQEPTPPRGSALTTALGLALVLGLAVLVSVLAENVPGWSEGTALEAVARPIEFPVYAIAVGFLGNAVLTGLGVRERLAPAFRTEFYIKTGLVLLGAGVNINLIVSAALPAILQALLLITTVFLFTWWFAGLFGLEDQLRALLASALSICGVSAAVAAAGAVQARKEQLAYVAGLVILFAVPSIFLLPWLAELLGLSPAVAGAWIGGNIDTTAAVTAAGSIAGEEVLTYASVVKLTQNALLGIVAVALSLYFTLRVAPSGTGTGHSRSEIAEDRPQPADRSRPAARPGWAEVWRRFPKFVLGFLIASVLVSALTALWPEGTGAGDRIAAGVGAAGSLQTFFFTLAFVSIGLEFRAGALREAGWKPLLVFFGGTVVNLVAGLALALLIFGWLFAGVLR